MISPLKQSADARVEATVDDVIITADTGNLLTPVSPNIETVDVWIKVRPEFSMIIIPEEINTEY